MKTKFLGPAVLVLLFGSTVCADDLAECERNDAHCGKVISDKTVSDSMRATIMQISCEEHKNAKSCVGIGAAKGLQGLDEVGIGYLELACRLDKSTCKALTGIKCLMAKNREPECVRGNEFFNQALLK